MEAAVKCPDMSRGARLSAHSSVSTSLALCELLVSGYDSEEAEAQVDITAAGLAVIEAESGVRLDEDLIDSPHSALLIPR
ncbi:hypothetical protein FLW16_39300 [Microbispora sp. KK1-11]|nr:hypothetical protein FLW16_39300 [Microbispora sp. KK1-11]